MRPPPAISLSAAKDLRARARRVGERAALAGTARGRFLREQRHRVVLRLVPALATIALATGAGAIEGVVVAQPASARVTTLAQGLTAIVLAALALAGALARRRLPALHAIAAAGGLAHVVGWSVVAGATGGAASPYALASTFGVAMLVVLVPLPAAVTSAITAFGVVGTVLSAPDAPASAYALFALLFVSAAALARQRRRRELASFRRVQRLAGAVAKLRRMQDELIVVEKLEALRVLVGGMAHELNNALTVSAAYADQVVAVAERDPAAAVAAAQRVSGGLGRIGATIERLRRFATATEQVLEPADVCGMVDFALESAIGRARSGVIVERHYEGELGAVACHVAALAEALVQVAKNAVESMPRGGTVRARVCREGDRVVISVADEGQGIPPERLARVFDPFFAREHAETLTGGRILPDLPGRTGLGLSAVYGIVRAIGGEVRIESEVGRGTEVTLSVPLSR